MQKKLCGISGVKDNAVAVNSTDLDTHWFMETLYPHWAHSVPNHACGQGVATKSCGQVFSEHKSTGIASHREANR
ncbi:hypothetical protein [Pseudaminobacter soli (ex Li et al. 2025)]|uniref:hypothetical protein n=1 Tax=Pseudaminobacter soli (ex Li et al. 2025) TaxID=1295366 RepID=UPI0015E6655B|nr:hypothetical protein [Mesorhizobium soli]